MGFKFGEPSTQVVRATASRGDACAKCGGLGRIQEGPDWAICRCRVVREVRARVAGLWPGEIPAGTKTDLVEPMMDLVETSLWITGAWARLGPELALGLCMHLTARWPLLPHLVVVTDEDLRVAHFGDGVSSLLEDADLVVVRVGLMATKNASMPGVLLTTVRAREALGLPTWIVDDDKKPISKTHVWSDEVEAYLTTHMRRAIHV
jgi:hypothetical protein